MAVVFDTWCRKCGARTSEVSNTFLLRWEGGDIGLMHPGESWQLENYGLTLDKAASKGLLRLSTAYACRECGGISDVKSLSPPSEGTVVGPILLILLITCFAVLVSHNPWLCVLVGLLGFVPARYIDMYVSRKRALRKYGFPVDTSCQHCGSPNTLKLIEFLSDKKARLLCSSCGERERVCGESWIS